MHWAWAQTECHSWKAAGASLSPVWYELPVFYFTNPRAVHAHDDDIAISPGSSWFDYELEVAAVIGKAGSDIPVDAAGAHIGGFMLMADWSARDLQMQEIKVGLGPAKSKDGATSFGPWLVTPDELTDVRTDKGYDIAISAHENDVPYAHNKEGIDYARSKTRRSGCPPPRGGGGTAARLR